MIPKKENLTPVLTNSLALRVTNSSCPSSLLHPMSLNFGVKPPRTTLSEQAIHLGSSLTLLMLREASSWSYQGLGRGLTIGSFGLFTILLLYLLQAKPYWRIGQVPLLHNVTRDVGMRHILRHVQTSRKSDKPWDRTYDLDFCMLAQQF